MGAEGVEKAEGAEEDVRCRGGRRLRGGWSFEDSDRDEGLYRALNVRADRGSILSSPSSPRAISWPQGQARELEKDGGR